MSKALNLLLLTIMLSSLSNSLMLRAAKGTSTCTPYSGFASSCSKWKFSQPGKIKSFTTICKTGDENKTFTGFDLNLCFANSDGNLVYSGGYHGGFSKSCNTCFLEKTFLHCMCQEYNGAYKSTSIDLNLYLGNRDGVAKCARC
jgi:hypothetical protein